MFFNNVIETSNGEFLAVASGGVIVRYDAGGGLLWQKYYDEDEFTKGQYVTDSGDGNFVIVGTAGVYDRMIFL